MDPLADNAPQRFWRHWETLMRRKLNDVRALKVELSRIMETEAEMNDKTITERELKTIWHALYYEKYLHHGDPGHQHLMLLAKLARWHGFTLEGEAGGITIPAPFEIVKDNPAGVAAGPYKLPPTG